MRPSLLIASVLVVSSSLAVACGDDSAGTGGATSSTTGTAGVTQGTGTATTTSTGHTGSATSTTGSGTGGAAGCAGGGFLLCEDFEGTAVGQIPSGWQFPPNSQANASNTGVDDAQAHGGTHALKVVSGYQNGISTDASSFGSAHWGRMHYFVQQPIPPFFVHTTAVFLHGNGPVNGSEEVRVVGTVQQDNGSAQFLYNVQPQGQEFGTGTDYDYGFEAAWHCAEWHIDGDNQSYHFYYDGTEIDQLALDNGAGNYDNTDIPPSFDSVFLGWSQYQMNDGANPAHYTVWLDDFAIKADRVGCAP